MGRANEERAFVLCKVEIGKDSSGDDGKGMGIGRRWSCEIT